MGISSKGANNAPSDKAMTRMGGPWMPLQQPAQNAVKAANKLFKHDDDRTFGPGVVADFDPSTRDGIARGTAIAGTGAGEFADAFGYTSRIAGGGEVGTSAGQQVLNRVGTGGVADPTGGAYGDILDETMAGSGGLDYLRGAANGDNLQDNPYLQRQVDAATRGVTDNFTKSVMPGIEGRMSQAGRLGSPVEKELQGAAYDALGRQLGDIEAGMRGTAYEAERGRQQQAGLALPGAMATESGAKLAAAGGQAGDVYQRLGIQLGAANSADSARRADVNTALAGQAAQGSAYNNQFAGADRAIAYGKENQAQQERVNMEAKARHEFEQAEPYERLKRYLAQLNGVAGMTNPGAATQYAMQETAGPSGWEVAIGNGMALAGTAASAYAGGA